MKDNRLLLLTVYKMRIKNKIKLKNLIEVITYNFT